MGVPVRREANDFLQRHHGARGTLFYGLELSISGFAAVEHRRNTWLRRTLDLPHAMADFSSSHRKSLDFFRSLLLFTEKQMTHLWSK